MGSRAGIVVTGTEVLTGRVTDLNGPWLAEQLRIAGVDIAAVVVVGDRADDMRWALQRLGGEGLDLLITSGGLGPTADDLTAEIVAGVQGRPLTLDTALEASIGDIVRRLTSARGWRLDAGATAAAVRKQAMVPVGASVLAPVGTAPGLVVAPAEGFSGPPIVVLPGPPRELQGMWAAALADDTVHAALAGRAELRQQTLRLWGTPESELAADLRELDPQLGGLEITTCLRDGELEVVTRFAPSAQERYDVLAAEIQRRYPETLFSADGRSIDEVVASLLLDGGLTIATAESCTAGMVAARLTDLAGSSAYLLGGLVVYSNRAKVELAGVPSELLDQVGAVSAEVAVALAAGARERLHADIGVGITGVAGPGGGTAEKPVGLVHLCISSAERVVSRRIRVPGSRSMVRDRSTVVALHMVRELLSPQSAQSAQSAQSI
ncbi:competence/damage-inducible protein cinA [Jatrophihabitans sp. GAS493]|uniref:competence/damage-inducible protein A n=1 Tax=Jatrophihabitans sp. GAS493 TaxID=1907575 RepID=UPI000BB7388E|nr:competence/damage-inducible protein A [Jatrophihabitans sp. GAS493]SOD73948.1 competence/damage-inducible protein cinA [Jatrophihabitans sp. GAS493]